MRLTDQSRQELFEKAKSINPLLGDLFQNPMDIGTLEVERELDAISGVEIMLAEYTDALRLIQREV